MNKEHYIINNFKNNIIGDDGAFIDGFVYSKDLFVENSHFKIKWLSFYEIGRKAVMVNISDTIVMNAKPLYALLGLAIPKRTTFEQINELNKGISDACEKFNVKIIGGDTISNNTLGISITIIGKTKHPIYRSRLKNNDLLAFTGKLGGSLKALRTLRNGGVISKNSRFKNVILRDKFFYNSAKFIRSAMDISDGLRSDLKKFVRHNDLIFTKKLNFFEFNSGEEYEILFACNKKNKARLINEAKKARINLTFFAKTKKGKYNNYGKNEHF